MSGIKTYTVEIRCRFSDEASYDLMTEATREAARTMVTTAMMLKDPGDKDPQIAITAGDMFQKDMDVKLFADGREVPAGE